MGYKYNETLSYTHKYQGTVTVVEKKLSWRFEGRRILTTNWPQYAWLYFERPLAEKLKLKHEVFLLRNLPTHEQHLRLTGEIDEWVEQNTKGIWFKLVDGYNSYSKNF